MSVPTSTLITTVLIQVIIVGFVVRRSYAMSRGVPYSSLRIVALPILLVVLWGASEVESLVLTPYAFPYLIALDAGLLAVTAWAFAGVAQRLTEVYADPPGTWNFRIAFWVTGLFLAAFVARLVLALALFPESLVFSGPPSAFLPPTQQFAVAAIDAVYSVSVGLLIGRSAGIRRKWLAARATAAGGAAPSSPGPSGC